SQVHAESINMGARTINGAKFDHDTPTFTLNADSVQAWTLKGALNHPFHLHVYHVQVQAACGGDFEAGEYYDTGAGNCAARFHLDAATASPYRARTIMHCHILAHEDQGAMGWANVLGGTAPPTFPAGLGYSANYTLTSGPPTSATAVDVGSVSVHIVRAGQGVNQGHATVVVVDDLGAPVARAVVTGDFTGTISESGVTGPATDAHGTTAIQTTTSVKGSVSLTFCVTSIDHSPLTDW